MTREILTETAGIGPDELFRMSRRTLKKHDVASIWLHWFNAMCWFLLFLTGSALFSSQQYTLIPEFLRSIIHGIFGSTANLIDTHIALGTLWICILLPYGLFGFRHYLMSFFTHDLMLDWDDVLWLQEKPKQIIGMSHRLPPQGIYNAGQKLYGMVVALGTTAIMLSGVIMAFHIGPPLIVRWAIVLHFLGVGSVIAGLVVHIYMAAILPEERPAFFSMFTGRVSELYAYLHHRKWWEYMKEEERKFHEKLKQYHAQARTPDETDDQGTPSA